MKKIIGFCLAGLCVVSAWGAGAPLLLDWGAVDTTSAEQQKLSQRVKRAPKPSAVQRLSSRGAAPWLVQFNGVIREEWKTALEAAGAELKGYIPENAFLVEATPAQIAAIGALADVGWVGEYLPAYKRARAVRALLAKGGAEAREYNVTVFRLEDVERIAQEIASIPGAVVTAAEPLSDRGRVRAWLSPAAIEEVTGWGEVEWVAPYLKRQLWNDVAVRTNLMGVTNAWSALGLTGAGQTIAVCDTGLDTGNTNTLHRDFTNRVVWAQALGRTGDWSDEDSHGTHVAGSVLGNGTSSTGRYKGVAYQAKLVFQSVLDSGGGLGGIPSDLNVLFRAAFTNGARIHSDSWGVDDNGYYSDDSRGLDQYVWSNKTMLVLVAAGNAGIDANSDGVVDFDSIGSPATAKNCLTVGAAETDRPEFSAYTWGDSWPSDYPASPISVDEISGPYDNINQGLAAFSSRGPCDDGRIKPDIVAPGTDIISTRSRATTNTGWGVVSANTNYLYMGGTSMATPLTAGAAGLARQWVTTTGGITNPSAALLKALLINGARNMSPGQYGTGSYREIPAVRPSNVQGWGHVDLYNTLQPSANQFLDLYDTNSLSTGQTNTFTLTVGATSTNKFVLAMVYSDYWAAIGAGRKLVNDLDLTVQKPSGAYLYANGRTSVDATNNVEMIEFAADETGTYTVRVAARTVPYGTTQAYALVIRGPEADETPAAPVFGANPGPLGATTDVERTFTVTASGYPAPVLALHSQTASGGYSFAPATGVLTYAPPVADGGATKTFTFTASNSVGVVSQIVSVAVSLAPPAAPAAIWASATNTTDFTAAWSAVSGATGYRLDVGTNSSFGGGGGAALDIGGYDLLQYDSSQTYTIPEGTVVEPGGYVIISRDQDQAAFEAQWGVALDANVVFLNSGGSIPQLNGAETFLLRDASDATVDGQTAVAVSGQVTIQRTNASADATSASSWTSTAAPANSTPGTGGVGNGTGGLVINEYSEHGTYTYEFVELYYDASSGLPAFVPGYSNLAVAGTSQSVAGLAAGQTYYFRARATNSAGTSANSPVANVTTLNSLSAPVFGANPGPLATTAGVAVAFTVTASGSPTPALALQSQTASSGYGFVPATGVLTYTPPQADGGATRTFTFTASNSQGVVSQTVSVAVTAGTAPAFTGGAGPYSATVGVQVAFAVTASGTPAATLALQSQTASSGYSFTPATGAFTYAPPVGDVGARTFTFTASNVAGVATQTTSVTVSAVPATPPTMDAISNQSATTYADFEYTVAATPTDGDPILYFACSSSVDEATWLFDTNSGDFLFIPTTNEVGTVQFSFTATDKDGSSAPAAMNVAVSLAPPAAPAAIWASATNATGFTAAWSAAAGATGYRLDVGTNATFTGGGGAGGIFTVFRETMGTAPSTTTVAAHESANGFDNDAYAMSNGGASRTGDVRNTSASSGYADPAGSSASGLGNIWLPSTAGDYGFGIAGIDASGYDSLRLSFGYRKENSGSNATYSVEWSTNSGTAWTGTSVSNLPAAGAAAGWYMVSNLYLPQAASVANLSLRWVKTGGAAMRVDDVLLQGVTSGSSGSAYVPGYSNRTVSGTSESVEGLTEGRTYYFRARAVNAAGTSPDSATASVTTAASGPADQTISFPAIGAQVATNAVALSATASSGLAVSFAVGAGPGTISGLTALTFTGAGTVSIVASQAGDGSWNPAPAVTNTFTVSKAAAAVTLGNLAQTYDGTARAATAATVPPGLAVGFTYDGSGTAPTAVGVYAVTGTVNEALYQGSASGALTVTEAIESGAVGSNDVEVAFGPLEVGAPYELLYTTSLTTGDWIAVDSMTGAGEASATLTHEDGVTNRMGYYRIEGAAGPSEEIWGYVKMDKPGNSRLNVVGIPFRTGAQTLDSLMPPQDFSGHHNNAGLADQVMVWDAGTQSYLNLALYDLRAFGAQYADQTGWKLSDGFAPGADYVNPVLPAGSAVWIRGSTTNDRTVTLSGEVVMDGAATNEVVAGLQLVSNPFSETVGLSNLAIHVHATGHHNNAGLADQVMVWDAGTQSYLNLALYDLRAFGEEYANQTGWKLSDGFAPGSGYVNPQFDPGEGFWIRAVNGAFEWVETNKYMENLD